MPNIHTLRDLPEQLENIQKETVCTTTKETKSESMSPTTAFLLGFLTASAISFTITVVKVLYNKYKKRNK